MSPITVLMTVYNAGAYLKMTMESVLAQRYRNFEFLIIDDCSTDHSPQIVESYRDPRVRLVRNPSNLGQSRSLNAGLKLASGKYIARIDADDVALPGWLEAQVSFITANPHFAVVSTRAVIIDSSSRVKKILNSPLSNAEIILKSLTASPLNHVGSIMNKEVILKHGGYPEDFKIAADYALWSKLIENSCRLTTRTQILMAIRVHVASISLQEIKGANFEETAEMIYRNFKNLAGIPVEKQDAVLIGRMVYDVSALSAEDFEKGKNFLEKGYAGAAKAFSISASACRQILKQQLLVIDTKRMFAAISKGDEQEAVRLVRGYLKEFGPGNAAFVFYLFSFLGKGAMRLLPKIYEKASAMAAKFELWNTPSFHTVV